MLIARFGALFRQAKIDFRWSCRKSVLSLCWNKDTACCNGEGAVMEIEYWLALCYT